MVWRFVTLFVLTFTCALVLTPLVGILANKWNVVDIPRGRHAHDKVTPKLGGLAVFGSLLLVILLAVPLKSSFWVLLGTGVVFLLIGVLDDLVGMSPWTKLFGQLAAAIVLTIGGAGIDFVGNPFTTAIVSLGALSGLVTVIWIVGLVNVVNWSDGVDGLVPGVSMISALALAALSFKTGHNEAALLAIVFAGALAGFLVYNFYPAKIFLGDSGSMFVGYFLAVLGFAGGAKIATALLLLGVPILDSGFTLLTRLGQHKPLHIGDQNHLHFRLLELGFSPAKVSLIFYLISCIFGGVALFFSGKQKVILLLLLLVMYSFSWSFLLRLSRRKK